MLSGLSSPRPAGGPFSGALLSKSTATGFTPQNKFSEGMIEALADLIWSGTQGVIFLFGCSVLDERLL